MAQGEVEAAQEALDSAGQALEGSSFPIATAACLALRASLLLRQEARPPSQGSLVVWSHCGPPSSAAPATGLSGGPGSAISGGLFIVYTS